MWSVYLRSICLILAVVVLPGCPGSVTTKPKEKTIESRKQKEDRCDKQIDESLASLHPKELGILTDIETAILPLNQWLDTCGDSDDAVSPFTPQFIKDLTPLLTKEAVKELATMRFSHRDGSHIRDCRMYQLISKSVAEKTKNDLESVVASFYLVTRLVELDSTKDSPVPMTQQEVLMAGRGSAEDRAVAFAGILQQLRIDTILLQCGSITKTNTPEEIDHSWLVGVLLDGKVYLFSMQLGLPVPALDYEKSILPQTPATLAAVLSNDKILRQFDADKNHSYPLTATDFKSLQIKIICNNRFWNAANFRFQESLRGDREMIIYDSLLDDDTGKGLISRVMQFANNRWSRKDISVSNYLEKQYESLDNLSTSQTRNRENRLAALDAPVEIKFKLKALDATSHNNPSKGPQLLEIEEVYTGDIMQKIRMAQILGQSNTAIWGFQQTKLKIRRLTQEAVNTLNSADAAKVPIARTVQRQVMRAVKKNQSANFSAGYWSAICQIEQGDYKTAENAFLLFFNNRTNRPARSLHDPQARFLQGVTFAENGKFASASISLKGFPQQSPHWLKIQYLLKRWKKIKATNSTATTPPKKTSVTTPMPPKKEVKSKEDKSKQPTPKERNKEKP